MEVFRISSAKYADDLTPSGRSARWNMNQQWVLYSASSRSLASLELVVNRASIRPTLKYKVMVMSLTDDESMYHTLTGKLLPKDWRSETAYPALQRQGSEWYRTNTSLVLRVPSAIVPFEYNYIINTRHPDFGPQTVSLVRTEPYFWDDRLL